MEETNTNFQALKKNIKDFSKMQNVDKKKRWSSFICHYIQSNLSEHFLIEINKPLMSPFHRKFQIKFNFFTGYFVLV